MVPGILIVDFGSQYTQLLAKRLRQLRIYAEIVPFDADSDVFGQPWIRGFILSGGPASTLAHNAPQIAAAIWQTELPMLGICYGLQALVLAAGGQVASSEMCEYGAAEIEWMVDDPLCAELSRCQSVWMSHGDHVASVSADITILAQSKDGPIAACRHHTKPWWGVQFHPEVQHTESGNQLLHAFAVTICQCQPCWQPSIYSETMIDDIRQQVGQDLVICALSGGVDSAVTATLIHRAIGTQLHCVMVDHGLLRSHEREQVEQILQQHQQIHLTVIDAKEKFFTALSGVVDPEKKRKIIGGLFIEVFESFALGLKSSCQFLAQGTIYSDVIESAGTKQAKNKVIKSHHNVGGLPEKLPFRLLEPIRCLFKDEVRELGLTLGLPHAWLFRHPFPGPGLAVRVLGEVTPDKVALLQQADTIFLEVLKQHHWYDRVAQAFAVFLPVKSVAVVGDDRLHGWVIGLRAVVTDDFMTAMIAPIPLPIMQEAARKITNQVAGISRVVWDISDKPPATIEWE